jgi:hypothetical protein
MSFLSLPDGSYLQLRPGENPAQGRLRAMQQYPEAFNLKGPEAAPAPPSGVIPALKQGATNWAQNVGTGIMGMFNPQAAGQAAVVDAKQPQAATLTNFQDVQDAFSNQGTLSGIGTLGAFARDSIVSNLPNMAASIAGAKAGAMAGGAAAPFLGPLAPVAPLAGGALGAFVPSLVTQAGSNIQRQAVEQDKAGQPIDVSRAAAYGTAVPQAGLDAASTFLILGKLGVAKVGGKPIQEAMKAAGAGAEKELLKAAERSVLGNVGRGFGRGAAAEMPTEVAQQVLERAQAGLPITGEEANREYLEVAAAAGISGGAFGGAAQFGAKGAGQQLKKANEAQHKINLKHSKDFADSENARMQPNDGPKPLDDYERNFVPGYDNPTVREVQPATKRGKDEDGVSGMFVGTGSTADALRAKIEEEQNAGLVGGFYADAATRGKLKFQADALDEADRMTAEERSAEEERVARVDQIEKAPFQVNAERRANFSTMLSLPRLRRNKEGVVDPAFTAELQTSLDRGVPTPAFIQVAGLPKDFQKLDPTAQLEAVRTKHEQVAASLDPSKPEIQQRSKLAHLELLSNYARALVAAAENPSGGQAAIDATRELNPDTNIPRYTGPRPEEVPQQPPAAPVQDPQQLDLIPGGSQPLSSSGPLAVEAQELGAQKTQAEEALAQRPFDQDAQDQFERVQHPFQQARERQLAMQAREGLQSALQSSAIPSDTRQLLQAAYDILSRPDGSQPQRVTDSKEQLAAAAERVVNQSRMRQPVDAEGLREALLAFQTPDTRTRPLFGNAQPQKGTPETPAAKLTDLQLRNKIAEWTGQLKSAKTALDNAIKASREAVVQFRKKDTVLYPLRAKLNAVNKTLAILDKRDPNALIDKIERFAEGEMDPANRRSFAESEMDTQSPNRFAEGQPKNERPLTPAWLSTMRAQIVPAQQALEKELAALEKEVDSAMQRADAEFQELQSKVDGIKAQSPAKKALEDKIAARRKQLAEIAEEARKVTQHVSRSPHFVKAAPVKVPVAKDSSTRAAAMPPPVPGTKPSVVNKKTATRTNMVTEEGDPVYRERTQTQRFDTPEATQATPPSVGWSKPARELTPEERQANEAEFQREVAGREEQIDGLYKKAPKTKLDDKVEGSDNLDELTPAQRREVEAALKGKKKAEGQRGQTQDPFSTPKADDVLSDPKQRLLGAATEAIRRRFGDTPTPQQTRDGVLYAAMDLLDDPAALGVSPLHAKALQQYLSLLDGLTKNVTVNFQNDYKYAGEYFAESNSITLDSKASVATFVHELAHAATVKSLADTVSAYRANVGTPPVENIRKATPEQLIEMARGLAAAGAWPQEKANALENLAVAWGSVEESGRYGGANILEFAAEWYADPTFADFASKQVAGLNLKDTTPNSGFYAKLRKLADKVRNFMADFLGLTGLQRTAFERISNSVAMFHDNAQRDGSIAPVQHKPDMSHLESDLQTFSDVIQHKKDPGLWATIKANITGMGFRVNVLDTGGALEEVATRARDAGKIDNDTWLRTMWPYRQANLTSHYMRSMLADKEAFFNPQTGMLDLRDSPNTVMNEARLLAEHGVPEGETTFQLYKVAKRAQRVGVDRLRKALGNEGLDSTWTKDKIDKAARLNEQYPIFDKLYEMANARHNALLDLMAQSGRMPKEQVELLKSFGDYVPFYRADDDGTLYIVHDDSKEIAIGKIDDPQELKALQGGKGKIKPYFTNEITNTRYILNSALRNNALRQTVKVAEDLKLGYRTGTKRSATRTLTFYEDGQEKFFEFDDKAISDPEQEGLYDGVSAELIATAFMGTRYALPAALKLMQYPARLLRQAVTRSPLYPLRQLLREPITSNFTAGNNTVPLVGALQALVGAKQEYRDSAKTLERYGIVGGQALSGTTEDVQDVLRNLVAGKTPLNKALAALDKFAMAADMSTRQTIFASAMKQGMSEPEAALMALESMNFTRHGALPTVQMLSMLVPFLNAQLQGLDVLYKSARGKMAFNDRLGIQRKFFTRAAIMSGMAMAYAASMSDEEPWKTANEQERDMNWFVPVPGVEGAWIKVPVNFEIGYLFKALPERMMAIMQGDDKATSVISSFKSFAAQTFPNPIPQAIKPVLEWWTNYSFFTGRPIQTERMMSLDPSQRFTERTSELAKAAGRVTEFTTPTGQKVGLSPAVIEHLVRGYTSQLGMVVMQTAGGAMEAMDGSQRSERPTRELYETPLFGPALANTRGFGPTNKFYEIKTELDRRANTLRDLAMQDPDRARQYAQDYAQDAAMSKVANQISGKLNQLRKQQAQIWYSDADPDEKQRKIRQLREAELQLVSRFNVQYQALR